MKLLFEEKQDIIIALNMRCNYIETGDITCSAIDAENMGKDAPEGIRIRALSLEQMELILRMRKLIEKLS